MLEARLANAIDMNYVHFSNENDTKRRNIQVNGLKAK